MPAETTNNHVRFELGEASDLWEAFSWTPSIMRINRQIAQQKEAAAKAKKTGEPFDQKPITPSTTTLTDAVEHAFNQTLLRDLNDGSWAQVYAPNYWDWDPDQILSLNITSPKADVQVYADIIPRFIAAMEAGVDIYKTVLPKIIAGSPKGPDGEVEQDAFLLLPFGLAMGNSRSIQLLHYPPSSTLDYMDYLYSPTNRRWETLLMQNGVAGGEVTLYETITDIVPLAANGGSSGATVVDPYIPDFVDYAKTMIRALQQLTPDGKRTQPLVAYGGSVGPWLYQYFGDQMTAQGVKMMGDGDDRRPEIAQAFFIKFQGEDGPATPVITANHPISFNYYDGDLQDAEKEKAKHPGVGKPVQAVDAEDMIILQQDLVCAGWQAEMGASWRDSPDPVEIRDKMMAKWTDPRSESYKLLLPIFHEQVLEYAMEPLPVIDTKAWWETLKSALPLATPDHW